MAKGLFTRLPMRKIGVQQTTSLYGITGGKK